MLKFTVFGCTLASGRNVQLQALGLVVWIKFTKTFILTFSEFSLARKFIFGTSRRPMHVPSPPRN